MKIYTPHEAKNYNAQSLAFLGDSVYELWIRSNILYSGDMQLAKLHDKKISFACAEFQAKAADKLESEFTPEEADIYRKARHAKGLSIPKHATQSEYRKATGLEAVFGYLYLLGNTERIDYLMNLIYIK